MSDLREAIKALPPVERQTLDYAFENHIEKYVLIGNKKFVGVHVQNNPNLNIEVSAGAWSIGTIKSG